MSPQVGCARLEAGELRNFAVPKAFSEGGERVLANDKRDPYAVDEKALSDLDKRIRSARKSTKDPRKQPDDDAGARRSSDMSLAFRMSSDLVAGVLVGAFIGWGLDWVFGSSPFGLIVFLGAGTVAGVRNLLRTVRRMSGEDGKDKDGQ